MKFTLVFLALALLAGGVGTADVSLGEREWRYIRDALDMMHIGEEELGFEKRWATDSLFRLPVVDSLMADPLHSFDYADECSEILEDAEGRLDDLLRFECRALGFRTAEERWSGLFDQAESHARSGMPEGVTDAVVSVLSAFEAADEHLKRAFKQLSDDEKSTILVQVPVLWSDEELPWGP